MHHNPKPKVPIPNPKLNIPTQVKGFQSLAEKHAADAEQSRDKYKQLFEAVQAQQTAKNRPKVRTRQRYLWQNRPKVRTGQRYAAKTTRLLSSEKALLSRC